MMRLQPEAGREPYGPDEDFSPSSLSPQLRLGSRPARILIMDGTFSNNGMLERRFEALGASVMTLGKAPATAATARTHNPDLILLGDDSDTADRIAMLQELQNDSRTHAIPVFVLGPNDDIDRRILALDAGAQDYIGRPFSSDELIARIRVVLRLKRREDALRQRLGFLERLSRSDPLTSLLNRRAFEERLYFEMERAKTNGHPLSCLMCDVDWFKDINDRYGHQVGDDVLQQMARILLDLKRAQDAVCRYGGEEFVWLLPMADRSVTMELGESLRSLIADAEIPTGTASFHISVSVGASTYDVADHGVMPAGLLIEQADRALLGAKEQGKNRVVFREPLMWEDNAEPQMRSPSSVPGLDRQTF
jgi:two-component system cell cycle response regulator